MRRFSLNKKTHRIFAEILLQHLSEEYGIFLNRPGFILGSIAPDLTLSFVIKPHERQTASDHVKKRIQRLGTGKPLKDPVVGFILSEQLGALCHYCADFFCEAHTPRYSGNVHEHWQYEKALGYYCRLNRRELTARVQLPKSFESSDPKQIFEDLEKMNDLYLKGEATFSSQAEGALNVCLNIVGKIMMARCDTFLEALPEWSVG